MPRGNLHWRKLAPADLRKDAGAFDLPIALDMLVATGQITSDKLEGFASVGELALDGAVRPVAGALSMAMEARAALLGSSFGWPTRGKRPWCAKSRSLASAHWRTRSASRRHGRPLPGRCSLGFVLPAGEF